MADPNMFTAPFQLTKGMHRDVYAAVDPEALASNASGKVVLVTGASGGLGFAIAKAWAAAGAEGIIIVGRDRKNLEGAASEIGTKVPILVAAGSISNEADVQSIFAEAIKKFGRVDVVINSAGVANMDAAIGQVEPAVWWIDFETNVKGLYNVAHHFIKVNGGKGTFINLATLGASFLVPAMSPYSASKLAAIKFLEYLDLEQPEMRVFSLHPGIVEAEGGRGGYVENFVPFAKDKQALSAGFTMYLQKPEADYLRGGFVSVNWDVEEMEQHKEEIIEGKLLKLAFLGAKLGPEGHPWKN
ncbi:hypothetical protein BDV95DRAFT_359396 [Massariosphaeria phaeospora]|uniref:Ketoreductase domain-containing protein n=1 Tax=Massariosphaeria phaeospora TaxID=100035 RepID=A0A7C8MR06_9PLEO|nr:hypothetical protein BDV95DRAFT_359396 [Massariosphaeria phaeospora]